MFQDNTALTWMLVILNTIFFILVFAGLLFSSIAANDMRKAKAAMKDSEKLFAEQSKIWDDKKNELAQEIDFARLRCRLNGCQHD